MTPESPTETLRVRQRTTVNTVARAFLAVVLVAVVLLLTYTFGVAEGRSDIPAAERAARADGQRSGQALASDQYEQRLEAAQRAIAEADRRAQLAEQAAADRQAEIGGDGAELDQREAAVGQAEETQPGSQIPGVGTFLVGEEVRPGRYRTPGGAGLCYVARLNSLGGGVGDVISNELSQGPIVIQVRGSDEAVQTRGCEPFQRLG